MASGSHGILEGVCRVMNAKTTRRGKQREKEGGRENKWQAVATTTNNQTKPVAKQ